MKAILILLSSVVATACMAQTAAISFQDGPRNIVILQEERPIVSVSGSDENDQAPNIVVHGEKTYSAKLEKIESTMPGFQTFIFVPLGRISFVQYKNSIKPWGEK